MNNWRVVAHMGERETFTDLYSLLLCGRQIVLVDGSKQCPTPKHTPPWNHFHTKKVETESIQRSLDLTAQK